MLEIILSIAVVSLIGAALAALLVIAERFIANYGPCTITINDDKSFTLEGGGTLLESLVSEKIFIPSACGGRGTCGYCKVQVKEGAGPLLPTEEPFLEDEEKKNDVRLSCQIKVRNDLQIVIPEELLSVQEYTCRCTKITDLTHDIKLIRLELIEPDTITYIPGQYVQLLTPVYEGSPEEVYRAYSIASDPNDTHAIELIIRLVPGGICTTYVFEHLKKGDNVKLNGPYGEFRLSDTDAPALFIAGGSGMAPIRCILHHMHNNNIQRKSIYYFGANLIKELFQVDEMRHFEEILPDFKFVPVVAKPETEWDGATGLVTEALEKDMTDASEFEAYLCGSPGMIDASIIVLKKLGVAEDKIYYDKFA